MENNRSPRSPGARCFAFWAAEPFFATCWIAPKLSAWTQSPAIGQTCAIVSITSTASSSLPPWPPSSTGIVIPASPCSARNVRYSRGSTPSSSRV